MTCLVVFDDWFVFVFYEWVFVVVILIIFVVESLENTKLWVEGFDSFFINLSCGSFAEILCCRLPKYVLLSLLTFRLRICI